MVRGGSRGGGRVLPPIRWLLYLLEISFLVFILTELGATNLQKSRVGLVFFCVGWMINLHHKT